MIDTVRLNLKAGNGGNGCVSFLREKYRPHGGPNGGDGGTGGSVYICGDTSLNTLLHLKFNSTVYADRGAHGKGKDQRGSEGTDTFIQVPMGTEVSLFDHDGGNEFLFDVKDSSAHVVARGGEGGWGNARFASSTNQEPVLSETGEKGESVVLFLELKLLADVGLLACPNAGKSTLLSRCSAAKPKVADYPFTTVEPALGVVQSRDKDFVMMEVPGLLEGAHRGVGLGLQFLRHAERTRVFVHLMDGMAEDPVGDFEMLNAELEQFSPQLAGTPQITAVNKVDVTEVRERKEEIVARFNDSKVAWEKSEPDSAGPELFFISAVTGEGVEELLGKVVEVLDSLPRENEETSEQRPEPAARRRDQAREKVYRDNDVYVVESAALERLAALADTRDRRVILQLWREMTRRGLARRLAEAGIEAGDTIRIGRVEVEWF